MDNQLKTLIESADANGWDFFNSLLSGGQPRSQISAEQIARAEKLAHTWAGFYATEHGREAIEHLFEITHGRAVYTAALGLPMEAAYGHGCLREGQNTIVHVIAKMIAQGRKENPPQERTAT